MKKAVLFTAYNRLTYLQQVLHTWQDVRGLEDWHFVAMIEPSPLAEQIQEEFDMFVLRKKLTDFEIIINPQRYGVLHHPWVGFEKLFSEGYDFVVRAEDDLIVADDILEYFEWVAKKYATDPRVATTHAFSQTFGDAREVIQSEKFSPLVWGTWADRWTQLIGPTWDHTYSTYNGTPGNQAGWDWNLNTRLFPAMDLRSVCPVVSRVDNIGLVGTHSTAENFIQSGNFSTHQSQARFREVFRTGR